MKHIIITGASGLVATELIFALLKQPDTHLYLLSTHVENIQARYKQHADRVSCFTLDSFAKSTEQSELSYDFCFHTAFARSSIGSKIVESIDYQRSLLYLLKGLKLKVFVNISSQSVYGKTMPLWQEDTPLDPDYLYAMGKYFSEVVTQQMLEGTGIRWTNIRLCSVCENARFVRVFVQNAIEGKPILLTAPEQQCSFIDVQDVADGLMALMDYAPFIDLNPVYNLGANIVNTIKEIAHIVNSVAENDYKLKTVDIIEQSSINSARVGMDASLFMNTFKWRSKRDMREMVKELFEMLLGGGTMSHEF